MFRIPSFYQEEISIKTAADTIKRRGGNDLLAGMDIMDSMWSDHCESMEDDDTFFSRWAYETNCYNTVYDGMSMLYNKFGEIK